MPLVMNVGSCRSRMTLPATPCAIHDRAVRVGYARPPMTATNEARKTGEHHTETISGRGVRTRRANFEPAAAGSRNVGGRKLCSNSRAGALDVEAGVLVVVHQASSEGDAFLLGQSPFDDLGFECPP